MTKPNVKNFCGGAYQDWLEVMLTPKCNGKCTWCIEKDGYKPDEQVTPKKLVGKMIDTSKKNIILLGGEPTLYGPENLKYIIDILKDYKRQVCLTTNGSTLYDPTILDALSHL